jgi:carbohydrate-binding DOMON domain-containing protein
VRSRARRRGRTSAGGAREGGQQLGELGITCDRSDIRCATYVNGQISRTTSSTSGLNVTRKEQRTNMSKMGWTRKAA